MIWMMPLSHVFDIIRQIVAASYAEMLTRSAHGDGVRVTHVADTRTHAPTRFVPGHEGGGETVKVDESIGRHVRGLDDAEGHLVEQDRRDKFLTPFGELVC
jgi:hypothetical protein